jgi:hypothetical protein
MLLSLHNVIYALQIGGLGNLIIGITVAAEAAASDSVNADSIKGKFDFCYQ